ncbi:MAG: septal ring lytic transglycosylase RlpA family protein [Chloroherpetonaceae bacterium]
MKCISILFIFIVMLLSSCQSVVRYGERSESSPLSASNAKEGMATYYADEFHGRKTASGETYDMNKLTAASVDLPLGTPVRVTNLENRKSVVVRINDRMPKNTKGRIIDLSLAGAKAIDMVQSGVVRVRVEVLNGQ